MTDGMSASGTTPPGSSAAPDPTPAPPAAPAAVPAPAAAGGDGPRRSPRMSLPVPTVSAALLPLRTRFEIFTRLLAIQGAWNYELLLGPGVGFCAEPALRRLPGGLRGEAYREALARQARYFNAHPYMAAFA